MDKSDAYCSKDLYIIKVRQFRAITYTKNKRFSESWNLQEASKLEHFQWGGGGGEVKILGVQSLTISKILSFQRLSYS